MKNKELFDRTVAILVKAYQNGTLEHNNCCACAVGNIIAGNMGLGFKPISSTTFSKGCYAGAGSLIWSNEEIHSNNLVSAICSNDGEELNDAQNSQLLITGYEFEQLCEIESAFESKYMSMGDDMFNGLMSVVDTLMQIHEATMEETESAKLLFVK